LFGRILNLGSSPICQVDLHRAAPTPDNHQVKVGVGLVDGLVLCPRRDEGKVPRPQLVALRLLLVALWLGKEHALAGNCVDDGFLAVLVMGWDNTGFDSCPHDMVGNGVCDGNAPCSPWWRIEEEYSGFMMRTARWICIRWGMRIQIGGFGSPDVHILSVLSTTAFLLMTRTPAAFPSAPPCPSLG